MAKAGEKEILTKYPLDSLEEEQVNLLPKGLNGIKSLVSREDREGL